LLGDHKPAADLGADEQLDEPIGGAPRDAQALGDLGDREQFRGHDPTH
jgi:hypothetical protein